MAAPAPRTDEPLRGFLMMCLAVACFTSIDTSAKWLVLAGLPALQVVFCRYAGHFLIALVAFLPGQGLAALRANRPWIQLLRALALLGSTIFNFSALAYLPLNVTTAIAFAGPIAVSILSIPILGERVGARRFVAIVVGFFGVLVVVQPWGAAFHPAMFLSLGTLSMASLYFVLTRLVAGTDSNSTSQIWSSGVATLALVPLVLGNWVWPGDWTGYLGMVLVGMFGVLGHSMATIAHRFAEASTLAPVVYMQVIFATLASFLFFDTLPTFWTIVGTGIIVASGIYIWNRERRLLKARQRAEVAPVAGTV